MDDHPPLTASDDAAVSQRNTEALQDEKEEDEEVANTSFHVAPSIAPPIPDSHAVLDAIRQDDDEWEENDRMIKEEIANRLSHEEESSDSRILNNDSTDDTGREEVAFVDSTSSGQSRHSVGDSSILSNVTEQSQSATSGLVGASDCDVLDASVAFAGARPGSATEAARPLLERTYDSNNPLEVPEAYLVKSTVRTRPSWLPALVSAEPLEPWHKRTWGRIMICIVILLATMLVIVAGLYESKANKDNSSAARSLSESPSFLPSLAPSFDSSPTLEIVRSRGVVRCGVRKTVNLTAMAFELSGFTTDLCSAVAGVVFGDPEKIEATMVTNDDRFVMLDSRKIDLLASGDARTLRREVSEDTTGSGFTFSQPYLYSSIVYLGEKELVQCVDDQIRFGNPCSRLKICVQELTTDYDELVQLFPENYLKIVPSFEVLVEEFEKRTCNVAANDILKLIQYPPFYHGIRSGNYTLSRRGLEYEPLAIVTRSSDRQWSDIIDGVMQGLRLGEVTNVTKDPSLCSVNYTSITQNISFMNAPLCVGNFEEIIKSNFQHFSSNQTGMSIHNNTGLITAPPFGPLDCEGCIHPPADAIKSPGEDTHLRDILAREKLRCGIVDDAENKGLTKMNEIYCRAVAAAIFQGDTSLVNISHLDSFDRSLISFGEFDVIAGGWRDYSDWSPELSGDLVFSVPYYYANSGLNGKRTSLVTREGDATFSSFVNAVVMATIYAVRNGISKELNSKLMPFIDIFGPRLRWMLKDVISSSGSYDEIYYESHGDVADRGWNQVVIGRIPSQNERRLCEISGLMDALDICQ